MLSPFLLTMVVEALSALFRKAKEGGFIRGFEVGRGEEAINHLQFANDTIPFSSSKWDEVVVLRRILRCFKLEFGLKINISKSLVVGVECPLEVVQSMADNLRCKVRVLPFLYLGLPVIYCGVRWWRNSRESCLCEKGIIFL
eukprot:TRINITY_DN7235_c1_g2_i2.p1 TRINITY_DN7235_c1_g2~~TRINITY_DN7235_c1_g2_i2.p1  ORF type:complete len:142 (+),score=22.66 TRINITY_DN7235_c1_g2_i2:1426-1851(+)